MLSASGVEFWGVRELGGARVWGIRVWGELYRVSRVES